MGKFPFVDAAGTAVVFIGSTVSDDSAFAEEIL
jgi:hypothetical protein